MRFRINFLPPFFLPCMSLRMTIDHFQWKAALYYHKWFYMIHHTCSTFHASHEIIFCFSTLYEIFFLILLICSLVMYCDATKHCMAVQWISLLYGTFTIICSPRFIILYISHGRRFFVCSCSVWDWRNLLFIFWLNFRAAYKGFADSIRLLLFLDAYRGRQDKEGKFSC